MASKVEILGGQLDGSTLDNAASESTLRELVEAIKKLEATTKASRLGRQTAEKVTGGQDVDANGANAALNTLGKGLNKGASAVTSGLGKLSGAALSAASGVAKSLGNMAGLVAGGTNSLSSFTNALSALPGPLGKFASMVASGIEVLEEYQEEQRKLSTIGASFNNSMMDLRITAARSGLSLAEFADVLKENAQSIGGLGDTITDGAKKLADVGNAVGSSGLDEQFMKLGMSATDARKAAMKFSTELVKGDKVRGASAKDLAGASLDYEKDLDLLAKQTGKSKDELRKFSEGMIKDGGAMTFAFAKMSPQMQAAMKSIMNTVGGTMGKGAQEALADIFSGAAAPSTEASAMFQSQMPGVVATFKQMQETAAWDAKTTEEKAAKSAKMDSLNAEASFKQLQYLQSKQGQFQMQNLQKLPPAQREFMLGLQAQAKSLSEQGIDINTASKADIERVMAAKRAEQEKQAALDKGFNAFQATITRISSKLQTAFFSILSPILEKLAGGLESMMTKFEGIGGAIEDMGFAVETLTPVIDFISDMLGIVLGTAFEGMAYIADKVWVGMQSLLTPIKELFAAFGITTTGTTGLAEGFKWLTDAVNTTLIVIRDVLGGVWDFLFEILRTMIKAITDVVNILKVTFAPQIEWVAAKLKAFGDFVMEIGPEILNGIRALFSTEGAKALATGVKTMLQTATGAVLSGIADIIPDWAGGKELAATAAGMTEAGKASREEFIKQEAAARAQAEVRSAAVAKEIETKKAETAAVAEKLKKDLDAGKAALAERRAREKADAESAADRKNAKRDQQAADTMERSQAAAIKAMRERAGIEPPKQPPVAPSPGVPTKPPAETVPPAGPSTPVQTDADMAKYLQSIALIESSGRTLARASGTDTDYTKSGKKMSAGGLFQFTEATWLETVKKMGKSYSAQDRFDPAKATEAAAFFSQQQKTQLEKGTGRKANSTDMYMAHFLGAGGATGFLKAKDKDPTQSAAALDRAAAASNENIYYEKDKKGNKIRERTVQEVYDLMDKKVKNAEGAVAQGKWGGKGLSDNVRAIVSGTGWQKDDRSTMPAPAANAAVTPSAPTVERGRPTMQNDPRLSPTTQTAEAKPTPVGNTVPNGQNTSLWSRLTSSTPAAPTDQAAKDQAAKGKPGETAMAQAAATNPITEVIANLNTNIAQLTQLQARANAIAEQQLRATNGLSRDAYKAV